MIKGIAQSERDNKWHAKHLRQLKAKKELRKTRLFRYQHGFDLIKLNKNKALEKMEKQRERDIQKGILKTKPSFFSRLFNFRRQTYA